MSVRSKPSTGAQQAGSKVSDTVGVGTSARIGAWTETAERLLDEAMPRWDVHERHQRVVAAPIEVVWRAVLDLTVSELPLTSALMRVRTFGAPLGTPDRPVVDALPPGEVARREPTELLLAWCRRRPGTSR